MLDCELYDNPNGYQLRTAKDVRTRMDEVMNSRGEGLVIKHPESEYVLNGRNRDWIKVSAVIATENKIINFCVLG